LNGREEGGENGIMVGVFEGNEFGVDGFNNCIGGGGNGVGEDGKVKVGGDGRGGTTNSGHASPMRVPPVFIPPQVTGLEPHRPTLLLT